MKITLTLRNSTALLFLSFLMQETHELAHTGVGRLLCGSWGRRDFNVWGLSSTCASEEPLTLLATFAGPLYSFAVIWIGYTLLTRPSAREKSVGFALVVLDQDWILGSPMLVTLWLFVSVTMVAIFHRHLGTYLEET